MSEIRAALLGALATGGFSELLAIRNRNKQVQSILVAICTEVEMICSLVRRTGIADGLMAARQAIENETWHPNPHRVGLQLEQNYFHIYESLASRLGEIPPHQCQAIVRFYGECKALMELLKPHSPSPTELSYSVLAATTVQAQRDVTHLLELGDRISQFPDNAR